MNCGNFKLSRYPKLSSYIAKKLGKDTNEYISLLTYVNDDIFTNIVNANNLVIEANVEQVYKALLKTKAIRTRDVDAIRRFKDSDDVSGFLSMKAKEQSINYIVGFINYIYSSNLANNIPSSFKSAYDNLLEYMREGLEERLSSISKNSEEAEKAYKNIFEKTGVDVSKDSEAVNKFLARYAGYKKVRSVDEKSRFEAIVDFVSKYGNAKDYNYLVMYHNLENPEFVNNIRLNSGILVVSDKDIDVQSIDELSNRIEFIEENQFEDDDPDNSKDEMAKNWNNDIGERSDFAEHVSDDVKFYLSSLPLLIDTKTNDEGFFNEDRNNELGVQQFGDAKYYMKLLYTMTDVVDVDSFIEGVKNIAENIKDASALIQLYYDLKDNKNLAYKFMQNFNLTVIPKVIVNINELENDKIEAKGRISNTQTTKRLALEARLYNNIKNLAFSKRLEKAYKARETYGNSRTLENLLAYAKFIVPEITEQEIMSVLGTNRTEEDLNNFSRHCTQLLFLAKKTRDVYNEWLNKKTEEVPETFIPSESTNVIYEFVEAVVDHIDIAVLLNSFNAQGKRSSDVINRNYLTVVNDIIHADKDEKRTAQTYAQQKFAGSQYNRSNFLIEHEGINYGLFRRVGNEFELTPYAKDMFNVRLLNGISNLGSYTNQLYSSMSDGDYLISALSLYTSSISKIDFEKKYKQDIKIANYLLPIPSDAPKNFIISAPRYQYDIFVEDNGVTRINKNSKLVKQYYNIIYQEIIDMVVASEKLFDFTTGVPVPSKMLKETPDAFYDTYHYSTDKQGNKIFYKTNKGYIEPTGKVFELKRLADESVTNDYFSELVGRDKVIDILYGGSTNGVRLENGELVLNENQRAAIENAVDKFLTDFVRNATSTIFKEFDIFVEGIANADQIAEFLLNDFLVRDAMYDMFGGNQSFFSKGQNILKRIKHIQGSGKPFGNIDYNLNVFSEPKDMIDTGVSIEYQDKLGKTRSRKVVVQSHFNAVTISNTVRPARDYVINNLTTMLTTAGLDKDNIERILTPFRKEAAANDAQSWITFEEWIRRITAAGEFNKYESLIRKLSDDTPLSELSVDEINTFVQIQKNFYYDLYYDEAVGVEVPRQVKNAEFVLVPKLIKGTNLEQVYNIMMRNNIHQLNTTETVKVAKHNILRLWDDNANIHLEEFEQGIENLIANKAVDKFTYNHLYRQQEVPQHTVDARNKAGIQIMKKIIDNLDFAAHPELKTFAKNITDAYVTNIEDSFVEVCTELGIELDKYGNIITDENGNFDFNKHVFFERFKENAARQNLSKATLEYFNTDEHGNSVLPLFNVNVATKLESIANGYINNNVTRQLIDGWHAAQLSDFGFNKLGTKNTIDTDVNLKYKVCSTVDKNGNPIYNSETVIYSEIYLPRWSNKLKGFKVEDLDDEIRTMVGYRIPTEGKQSVVVFKVVPYPGTEDGFLPSAYGSTVVVPHEFVHQTGSDFDVDSVYAMSMNFYYDKKTNKLRAHKMRSIPDLAGYFSYLKSNSGKAGRSELKKYFVKGDNLNEVIENSKKRFTEKFNEDSSKELLDSVAKEYGLKTFNEWAMMTDMQRASREARVNKMIESFIKILSNPGAYEENATVSGFENLKTANDEWSTIAKTGKRRVGPSGFLTQMRWFDSATSGIKLKGISVNLDGLGSIANVAKATHDKGITVIYPKGTITIEEAKARFNLTNQEVKELKDGRIQITHKHIGWSADNKNVDGYLINPYSSQTTAHILDVMKEGAIHNENTFTFNAFKVFSLMGSNYDTAIGFMHQPAIDQLVKTWKLSNSVLSTGYINVIRDTLKEYGRWLGMNEANLEVSLETLITRIDNHQVNIDGEVMTIQEYLQAEYGISSLSDAFDNGGLVFDREAYKRRLTEHAKGIKGGLFDLIVIAQFNELNTIGEDMSNNVNSVKADKYGAKASFFETEKIFRDIENCKKTTKIKVGDKTLVESIFPDIELGRTAFAKSDISNSSYPSLAAFLKYSTFTSVKICEQIFDTARPMFIDYVYNYEKIDNKKLDIKKYNAVKNYIIRKLINSRSANNHLTLPTVIIDGEFRIPPEVANNFNAAYDKELLRVSGLTSGNDFECKDILNPTKKEIIAFQSLTPVEKVNYIKDNFIGIGYFNYIETISLDERDSKKKRHFQYLRYSQGNASDNEVHMLFENAFTHPNQLIRLAALDCAKYAYMIEGNKFGATTISRSINNTPLYSVADGGLGIGDSIKSNIRSIVFSATDEINFVRTNPGVFNIPKYSNKTLKRKKISFHYNPVDKSYIIHNSAEISINFHPDFIIINHNIYCATRVETIPGDPKSAQLHYIPINGLESFEVNNAMDDSLIPENNKFPTLRNYLWRKRISSYNSDRIRAIVSSNIRAAYSKQHMGMGNIKSIELSKETKRRINWKDYAVNGILNSDIKHNTIYHLDDKDKSGNVIKKIYYIAITGQKAINLSAENQAMQRNYPNMDIDKFGVLVQVTYDDIIKVIEDDSITSDEEGRYRFSSIPTDTPLGNALREEVMYISDELKHDNLSARRIVNKLGKLNIDVYNVNQLESNSELATSIIYDYIREEGDLLTNAINHFPCDDGLTRRIDSDEVLNDVFNNKTLEREFLNTILAAITFRNKHRLFNNIDLNSVDKRTAEIVKLINDISYQIDTNNAIISASRKWLMEIVRRNTSDPKLIEDLTKIFTGYGDTSWADMWIQDIHANKDPIVQNIIKEFETRLETARREGIRQAKNFNRFLREVEAEARANGVSATLNSVIDNEGRTIRPYTEAWKKRGRELSDATILASARYGNNSVEHLKAKLEQDKFLYKTTVSKFKKVTIPNDNFEIESDTIEVDYEKARIIIEDNALTICPNEFAKYKQMMTRISEIYNLAVGGILTDEQQEEIGNLVQAIDEMTNIYNDDKTLKVGSDYEVAAALSSYSATMKELKEIFYTKVVAPGFAEKLADNLAIINRYETERDSEGRLLINREELMKIPEYANAKNWLRNNAKAVRKSDDLGITRREIYDILGEQYKEKSKSTVAIKKYNARDEFGIIDGRKIPQTLEEGKEGISVADIHKQTIADFRNHQSNGLPYGGIIRAASSDDYIYTSEFWKKLNSGKVLTDEEVKAGEAINKILAKHWDNRSRVLKTWELSIEELLGEPPVKDGDSKAKFGLIDYFETFNQIEKAKGPNGAAVAKFIEEECDVTYNYKAFNEDWAEVKRTANNDLIKAWESVFISGYNEHGEPIPNSTIYGIIRPKNVLEEDVKNKYVHEERTLIKRLENSNFRDVETPYYWMARQEMLDKYGLKSDEYREWFVRNHYWNPYERRYVPLRIWTMKEDAVSIYNSENVEWVPRNNNLVYTEKEEYLNPERSKSNVPKYKPGTEYDNEEYKNLNEYQHKIIDEINNIVNGQVITRSNQSYVDKGYIPAVAQSRKLELKDMPKEGLKFLGFWGKKSDNISWKEDNEVTFERDYDIPNQSLKELTSSDTEALIPVPKIKLEDETDEQFANRVKEALEHNNKVRENNRKVHASLLNKDWETVMDAFIKQSAREYAINVNKNLMYMLDNMLLNHEAYVTNMGQLKKDKNRSGETQDEYIKTVRSNTSAQVREYTRRVVFQQFKDTSHQKLNILGSLGQNIAGSKYMMMNITGGIANVLTGSANIMMERLASEYVSLKQWEIGKARWLQNSVSFLSNMYDDKSTSLADALVKYAKIIDFDRLVEVEQQGAARYLNRARSLMFSPQTIGEHYMQSTMLFSMMESHRVVETSEGVKIMSLELYTRDKEAKALEIILAKDSELKSEWETFKKLNAKNRSLQAKYDTYQRNEVHDFVRTHFTRDQQKEYAKIRKDMIKDAKKDFETNHPTVYSQFELVDGYAEFKKDAIITDESFSRFVNKVKEVNKKVHGVYDKIGAARIEHHWWGGLVMQYHKHLYPGFKKRYRINSYYNETLETIEKGNYISLAQFLAIPFDSVDRPQEFKDAGKAIQNYIKELVNFAFNITTEWGILPEHEKANIKRMSADFIYVGLAIAGAIVLCGLGDDDDDNILYHLAMYQIDRLATEAAAFNPVGAYAEFDKLWSSPVPIQQTLKDLLGTINLATGMLIDDNMSLEYTTGRYKGLNKFEVALIRNIPVVRNINNILEMPKHNKFYKLQENALGRIGYKTIAENLFGE